jgi:hypothetical protein
MEDNQRGILSLPQEKRNIMARTGNQHTKDKGRSKWTAEGVQEPGG